MLAAIVIVFFLLLALFAYLVYQFYVFCNERYDVNIFSIKRLIVSSIAGFMLWTCLIIFVQANSREPCPLWPLNENIIVLLASAMLCYMGLLVNLCCRTNLFAGVFACFLLIFAGLIISAIVLWFLCKLLDNSSPTVSQQSRRRRRLP
jgi:hypothetical protein